MERYQDLRLKIECFRLRLFTDCHRSMVFTRKLTIDAIKIGATDVELDFLPNSQYLFFLPQAYLVRLSLRRCIVDASYVLCCSTLKSLTLNDVRFTMDYMLDNIISSCRTSIEELSLSTYFRRPLELGKINLQCELHKLRRLFLCSVDVGNMFSSDDFASRFPFLKDLSILRCRQCKKIQIASTSLQTISFSPLIGSWRAKFDVSNIRKFIYSGSCSPYDQLSIKAAPSREWEFDISIRCNQFYKSSWFLNLKKYLSRFRLSRISLSIQCEVRRSTEHEVEVEVEVLPKPFVVENLMIDAPSSYCCALLVRLFGICRPKFITRYGDYNNDAPIDILCNRQSMFGQFGLKKVEVEWLSKTPANTPTRRAQLIWEDF